MTLRLTSGKYSCANIIARSRVSPIAGHTVPRLEISGMLLLSRLKQMVETEHTNLKIKKAYCLTDSMTSYLAVNRLSKRFSKFFAARIGEIQEIFNGDLSQWYFIKGCDNTCADKLTRPINASDMSEDSDWFRGPAWLYTEEGTWPIKSYSQCMEPAEGLPEELKVKASAFCMESWKPGKPVPSVLDYSRYKYSHVCENVLARIIHISQTNVPL